MKNKSISINSLDCTLRDGGYYNNWDFEKGIVDNYLSAIIKSKIEYVEIGFRNLSNTSFMGPYAYSRDQFLEKLNFGNKTKIGVMIDTKEVLNCKLGIKKTLDLLLNKKEKSPISLIRFATHFSHVNSLDKLIKYSSDKGYMVAINLMQTGGKSERDIDNVTKTLSRIDGVDVLYFADSLGNMYEEDIVKTVKYLRNYWHKSIGIHAHNNKGRALSNTLLAIEHGVTWVDSTVRGMGRGAGNAETENLLTELNKNYKKNYNLDDLYNIAVGDFEKLKKEFMWGESLFYSLAADNNIHPTYIQEMISDPRYNDKKILDAINYMKNIPSISFNKDLLDNLMAEKKKSKSVGSWNAKNWCKGKEVVVIGSGPSLKKYYDGVIDYITEHKPIVLCLNINKDIDQKYIDGYVLAKKSRTIMDSVFYKKLKKPIFASKDVVADNPDFNKIKSRLRDYGMNAGLNKFKLGSRECYLPNDLAISYAFALITVGSAKQISLIGFDGYGQNNKLQDEMVATVRMYKELKNNIKIFSLTPTSYPVESISLYAPKS